jgi:hypothetical protein
MEYCGFKFPPYLPEDHSINNNGIPITRKQIKQGNWQPPPFSMAVLKSRKVKNPTAFPAMLKSKSNSNPMNQLY